jgi:D-alanyl-D-alanine carboxypeptidase
MPAVAPLAAGALPPLSADALAAYDAVMDDVFALSKATGLSACVYIPGEGSWRGVRGVEERVSMRPITLGAMFHGGSVGKAITAALILQLVGRGDLTLDTTIDRWFPDAPRARELTIDHLLNHTGGLRGNLEQDDALFPTLKEKVGAELARDLSFRPGTGFSYSNVGYMALGLILEAEHGAPLAQVVEEQFILALGLEESRAITSDNKDSVLIGSTHEGRPGRDAIDYASVGGAGMLATTPCDLIRILNAALAGQSVSPQALEALSQRFYPMSEDVDLYWSRGLMVFDLPQETGLGRVFYLAGRIKGFGALVAYQPHLNAFVAVMVNDDTQIDPVMLRLFQQLKRSHGVQ